MIFYLQNAAEYLQEKGKENLGAQPVTLTGLAEEGRVLLPAMKDKEAVKAERELTKILCLHVFLSQHSPVL